MIDDVEAMIADLLLEEEETLTERFLAYLTMEITVTRLRQQGYSNEDILALCQGVDERRQEQDAQAIETEDRGEAE